MPTNLVKISVKEAMHMGFYYMACCLVVAKPLCEPMLEYHQLVPKEQIAMKF